MLFDEDDRVVIGGYVEELFQINANLRGGPVVEKESNVRVYMRCRPFNGRENDLQCKSIIKFLDDVSCEVDTERGVRTFAFDRVFREDSEQEQVFDEVKDIVGYAADGRNACCFSYGESQSGKSFTLFGQSKHSMLSDEERMMGITGRAMVELYSIIEARKMTDEIKVSVSMLELYNDELLDLFQDQTRRYKSRHKRGEVDAQVETKSEEMGGEDKTEGVEISKGTDGSETVEEKRSDAKPKSVRLEIKLDKSGSVVVNGAVNLPCASLEEMQKCFEKGMQNTQASLQQQRLEAKMWSPQSHLILRVMVETVHKATGKTWRGKLSFIDLAGGQRANKVGANVERLRQAKSVNQSLGALGDVISALSEGQKFVPYRNNKLTMLMRDSLGGDSKTLMIANISPSDYSSHETLNTLMYAARVKSIVNKPKSGDYR